MAPIFDGATRGESSMAPIMIAGIALLLTAIPHAALACDSLAVLPSATVAGLGGMYGKNADRSRTEAQPIAVHPRATHPPGSTITLDTGLVIPQPVVILQRTFVD